jgi:hypothetical protein
MDTAFITASKPCDPASLLLMLPGQRPQTPAEMRGEQGPPTAPGALYYQRSLGNIYVPKALRGLKSYGTGPLRSPLREVGILVTVQRRPVFDDDGNLLRYDLLTVDITHNERVDAGGAIQANRVFGTTGTTANGVITAVAVANAAIASVLDTHLSIGSTSAGVTSSEFTANGLQRATGTLGTYTPPGAAGTQFTQVISKLFTASGTVIAKGSALFDSTTVAGSNMYVEDNHTDASLVSGDTLTETWTIQN